MPYPAPPFRELVVSKIEKGTPVCAVNTGTTVYPPNIWCAQPLPFFVSLPFFAHGVSQTMDTVARCRTSKSELPQSSFGFRGSRYPKLPIPFDAPPVLSENVELR